MTVSEIALKFTPPPIQCIAHSKFVIKMQNTIAYWKILTQNTHIGIHSKDAKLNSKICE